MRILLAGGAGYIGSMLAPALAERGYDVEIVDLLWFGNANGSQYPVRQQNILTLTEADLKGFDQVIFLAGLSNDPMAEYSPSQNFIMNAAAPAYLAYIAKRAGVSRFIYAGSCSVYGYTVNELYDEDAPAISHYPYGISKLQGEQAVLQMGSKDFSVICLRQGTVGGFSTRMRLDLVVNAMFKSAVQSGVITVNHPAIWRPILAIRDAVSAYTRAVEANQEISGVYNIVSGNYTVGEIADIVKAAVERIYGKKVKLDIKHIQDYRNYKVSVQKAMNVLSFKPAHSVESIVEDLAANLEHFKDFDRDEHYNITIFKKLGLANNGVT